MALSDKRARCTASEKYNVTQLPEKALVLKLYYTSRSFDAVQEVEKYPASQVVANVGGFLGLLLGHSLLEILFTLVDKFCYGLAVITGGKVEKKRGMVMVCE